MNFRPLLFAVAAAMIATAAAPGIGAEGKPKVQGEWKITSKKDDKGRLSAQARIVKGKNGAVWARITERNDAGSPLDGLANAGMIRIKTQDKPWTFNLDKSHTAIQALLQVRRDR